jgi:DNA-binding IclR family transcriptional regulator
MSEPKPISDRAMSNSLTRMLDLLPLFSTTQPVLTLEEIVEKTGYARSTAYRYVKVLTSSGLLSPVAGRAYGLGPYIVELDRTIRITDPLLQVAPAVMSALNQTTGQAVILGRYFRRSVICVHQEGEAQGFTPTFGRGREMPKFTSATSRAILANLPAREIKEVYLADARQIAEAGLGADWAAFRGQLREFRARGYAIAPPPGGSGCRRIRHSGTGIRQPRDVSCRGDRRVVFEESGDQV